MAKQNPKTTEAGRPKTPAEQPPAENSAGPPAAPEAPAPQERRKRPRIPQTPPAPPPPPHFDDYEAIIGRPAMDEIRFLARQISGRRVKMVNSTSVGGGVAEILNRLVPLLNQVGVATGWEVITGGNDFFEVTKGFHNVRAHPRAHARLPHLQRAEPRAHALR
jgi:hypothetical protein